MGEPKSLTSVLAVFFCLLTSCVPSSPSKTNAVGPELLWTREHTEIESPSYSPDGKEIVLTIKPHEADGLEAEGVGEDELKKDDNRKLKNRRWADPQIVVLRIADHTLMPVDFGWSGTFSQQADKIYYDHQVKPISGFRRLAQPLSGNDIRVFDRKSKKSQVLVKAPKIGYLGEPIISADKQRLAYTLNDATNGDWGGSVGAGVVNLSNGQSSTVIAPSKKFDLYKLVNPVFWAGNVLVAERDVPADEGSYVADHYKTELINEHGKMLYRGTLHGADEDNITCGATSDGKVRVCIKQRRKCLLFDPLTGKPLGSAGNVYPDATFSPDGLLAAKGANAHLDVTELKSGRKHSFSYKGELRKIIWAPDSKQIVFVVGIGTDPAVGAFVRDELWCVRI